MSKTEAMDKVGRELLAYSKRIKAMKPEDVYFRAPEIMFTEATVARLDFLCKDDDIAALVLAGGNLEDCVKSIIRYCQQDIGRSGDISEDEFRACIRDYYRMPDKALKAEPKQTPAKPGYDDKGKKLEIADKGLPPPKPRKEPTMLGTQLDMFGALTNG